MSERPVFVGRLMTSPARTVSRETTLADAATKLHRHGLGSAVVVDQDTRIEGIVTGTDLVRATAEGADPATAVVGDYLTTDVLTTAADESAVAAARRMRRADVNHLPVVDENDGIVGMLTSTDLADYFARNGVPPEPEPDEDDAEDASDADGGTDADPATDDATSETAATDEGRTDDAEAGSATDDAEADGGDTASDADDATTEAETTPEAEEPTD